jgi:hypothetical protein
MAIGSIAPWADQEKNVCRRESSTISLLVIWPAAVLMPIVHLFGLAGASSAGVVWPGPRRP